MIPIVEKELHVTVACPPDESGTDPSKKIALTTLAIGWLAFLALVFVLQYLDHRVDALCENLLRRYVSSIPFNDDGLVLGTGS